MYKIKQIPEDFVVNEIIDLDVSSNGLYAYYNLKKTDYTSVGALQALSKRFHIPLKFFGFAGNKDKKAITEQKISIFKGSKNFEGSKFENIELKHLGNGKHPISLGDLQGNEFTITIRNIDENEIDKIKQFENKKICVDACENARSHARVHIPNFFGSQRFSKNNHLVGKAIVKKDFKKAVELILENDGSMEYEIKASIESNKNNYIQALRLIPLKTRKLFVHAYQSYLFNETIKEFLKNKENFNDNLKIPIIGFEFEIDNAKNPELKTIIKKIIEDEKINPRDFVIHPMPELTSEGNERDLFFELNDLKILEVNDDELNESKKKIKINFTLKKGCYATTLIDFIYSSKPPCLP